MDVQCGLFTSIGAVCGPDSIVNPINEDVHDHIMKSEKYIVKHEKYLANAPVLGEGIPRSAHPIARGFRLRVLAPARRPARRPFDKPL
jgi:hypothetical protein